LRLDIAAQTDAGRRKKNNEDAYGVFRENFEGLQFFKEGALLVVADGLGGHMGGEIASKLAVSIMRDMLKEPRTDAEPEGGNENAQGPLPTMCQWVKQANKSVYQTNIDLVQEGRPMGTTLLAALVEPKRVWITNVGDSRAYHIRDGEIIAMTEDHSWVDEQVKQGLMSKAEAEADSRKNIVTRSIGTGEDVDADTYCWHTAPGDMLMLCSDGLVNMVDNKSIKEEFQKGGTAADITSRLVALANENGGKDNITVIVANVSPNLPGLMYAKMRALARNHGVRALWLLITLLLVFGGFALGYMLGMQDFFGLEGT